MISLIIFHDLLCIEFLKKCLGSRIKIKQIGFSIPFDD